MFSNLDTQNLVTLVVDKFLYMSKLKLKPFNTSPTSEICAGPRFPQVCSILRPASVLLFSLGVASLKRVMSGPSIYLLPEPPLHEIESSQRVLQY